MMQTYNRVEVIGPSGRLLVCRPCAATTSVQDNGGTLKVFLDREPQYHPSAPPVDPHPIIAALINDQCVTHPSSSRSCERGTHCCVVKHAARVVSEAEPPAQVATPSGLDVEALLDRLREMKNTGSPLDSLDKGWNAALTAVMTTLPGLLSRLAAVPQPSNLKEQQHG